MSPSKRNTLLFALVSAVGAYLFFRADNFWGLVCAGLICLWALIGALPIMDGAWRTRLGAMVVALFASLNWASRACCCTLGGTSAWSQEELT